ncbi:MAG: InlB B-repeat-containing protein, partial [Clostridia bacterium]|nr:InlB B-repeat-containing protein [Clostridia bacterium]
MKKQFLLLLLVLVVALASLFSCEKKKPSEPATEPAATTQETPTQPPVATYSLVFADKDGATIGTLTVQEGDSAAIASIPSAPAVEGYTFAGWKLNGEGEALDAEAVAALTVSGDLRFAAAYTIDTHTVTFIDKDGEAIGTALTLDWGASVPAASIPSAPAVEGHTFAGWKLNGEGDALDADAVAALEIKADSFFSAAYTIDIHAVTFRDKDGEIIGDALVLDWGTSIPAGSIPSAPAVEGYTFAGWKLNGEGDLLDADAIAALLIKADGFFAAVYTVDTHTVTFKDKDGATIGEALTIDWGTSVASIPAAPAVIGQKAIGWKLNGEGETMDNAAVLAYVVKSDVSFNAVYRDIYHYTVKFLDKEGAEYSVQTVDEDCAAASPTAEQMKVYAFFFRGWKIQGGDDALLTVEDVNALIITADTIFVPFYEVDPNPEDLTWEGTPIRTQADLAAISEAGTYTIIKNIDLVEWTPIALPAGVILDGHDHFVTGATSALFTEIAGTVKNLKVKETAFAKTTTSDKCGALANKLLDGALISHVDIVDCDIAAYYCGGIAAEATGNITVEYCTVSGAIKSATTSGNARVGGIIAQYSQTGTIAQAYIKNCENNAALTMTNNNSNVGGIV